MALQSSGIIKLSDVNTELSFSANAPINLGSSTVRTLFGVASGTIRLSNGYGKSNRFATNLIPQYLFKQVKSGSSVTGPYSGGAMIYTGTGDETYLVAQALDNVNGVNSGSVYWFNKTGTLLGRIAPSDAGTNKIFGDTLSSNGKNVLIGATAFNTVIPAVYLFNSSMIQVAKLAPTGTIEDQGLWGRAISMGPESTNICAGLFFNSSNRTTAQLRIFNATTGAQLYAKSVTGMYDMGYGFGCTVTKTRILVYQAPYSWFSPGSPPGAVWVHDLQGNYISKILAPAPYSNTNDNMFSSYVACDPITNYTFIAYSAGIGVYDENLTYKYTITAPAGAASWPSGISALDGTFIAGDTLKFYYYSYTSSAATLITTINSPDALGANDYFGRVVQLWKGSDGGQRAVIYGYNAMNPGTGRIYIYK